MRLDEMGRRVAVETRARMVLPGHQAKRGHREKMASQGYGDQWECLDSKVTRGSVERQASRATGGSVAVRELQGHQAPREKWDHEGEEERKG